MFVIINVGYIDIFIVKFFLYVILFLEIIVENWYMCGFLDIFCDVSIYVWIYMYK